MSSSTLVLGVKTHRAALLNPPLLQVMRNFHLLMCSLAVYDLLHLVLDVACFALPEFSRGYRDRILLHGIPYLIPITQV